MGLKVKLGSQEWVVSVCRRGKEQDDWDGGRYWDKYACTEVGECVGGETGEK